MLSSLIESIALDKNRLFSKSYLKAKDLYISGNICILEGISVYWYINRTKDAENKMKQITSHQIK